jgi:tetratricopeptide (TPR) repeat protein
MNKQASIKYISGLLNDASSLADNDASSIAGLRQSYPYFVPARYLDALVRNRTESFSPALLTAVTPYLGNWILFCDFVAGKRTTDIFVEAASETAPVAEGVELVSDDSNPTDNSRLVERSDAGLAENAENTASVVDEVLSQEASALPSEADKLEAEHNNFWFQEEESTDVIQILEVSASSEQSGLNADVQELEAEEQSSHPVARDPLSEISEVAREKDKPLINPVYVDDYFLQQGERISTEMPEEISSLLPQDEGNDAAKSLMVMMSFSEWLLHFKNTGEKQKEETRDQRALKTMWQKEKLAAAIEEENEEIPENVFEMAVNSIAKEDGLASEPLAEIYIKQGKPDKAIEIYRKLSLRNPQKNAYFARKIEEILKEKKS